MATLIGCGPTCISLASTAGNDIENAQYWEVIPQDHVRNNELLERYGNKPLFRRRCQHISPIYNCHGMTFASRRTGIDDNSTIEQILEEDRYVLIRTEEVLPGDIILYIHADGDIEHSGIVIEPPTQANLHIPLIFSKWGKYLESVHLANCCPYDFNQARYYRINHGEFRYT